MSREQRYDGCSLVFVLIILISCCTHAEQDVLSAHERAWARVFDALKELAGHVEPSEAPARIKSELTNEGQLHNKPLLCLHAVGAVRGIDSSYCSLTWHIKTSHLLPVLIGQLHAVHNCWWSN